MLTRLLRNLFHPRPKNQSSRAPNQDALLEKLKSGFAALARGEHETSLAFALEALELSPHELKAILLQGCSLTHLGKINEAIALLKEVVSQQPDDAFAWANLGSAADKGQQPKLMLECFRASLEINPNQPDLHTNLANFLMGRRQFQDARIHYERAIALAPSAGAYSNLAYALYYIGRPDLAYDALKFSLKLNPDFVIAHRGLLTSGLYLLPRADRDNRDIYAAYLAYARRNCSPIPYARESFLAAGGRIKVGYVTSDFRPHPVARNMLPILTNHDRLRFEIHAYADIEPKEAGDFTSYCQRNIDVWHDIRNLSDEEVATMVARDQINILVILAGKFDSNRPQLCMYGSAPIHVSFHDASTSGLDKMDYLISDITMSPRDTPEWFSEKLIRLPTFYLHEPINGMPEFTSVPARKIGRVTFGSCNNPSKLSPKIFSLWARVLAATPDSHLILKFFGRFNEPDLRDYCVAAFAKHGIEASRLEFLDNFDDLGTHLSVYQHIDIALDPFPFNGSTTTFEALWMGVPVITLSGETMVSRWGTSMLRRIGHSELIAQTEADYVDIASNLARDLDRLEHLRHSLRDEVRRSPLCNPKRRTQQLERAYRYMWRKWQATHANPGADLATGNTSLALPQALEKIIDLAHTGKQGTAAVALEALFSLYPSMDETTANLFNDAVIDLVADTDLYLAARILDVVQKRCPNIPFVLSNLGMVHARTRRFNEAIDYFKRALEISPHDAPTLLNYANTLRQLNRHEEATGLLEHLIAHDPENLGAYLLLAELHQEAGNIQQACASAKQAVALAPKDANALSILGEMLRACGDLNGAFEYYMLALQQQPEHVIAQVGLSLTYLQQGQFEAGWAAYEARRPSIQRMLHYPEWEGQPLQGKTLLVYGEQGLGEQILFASCFPDLLRAGGRLIIDCEPQLASLYARAFPDATVFGALPYGLPPWTSKAPPIDYQIPAGSLPRLYRNKLSDFPAHQGYLVADQLRTEAWAEKLRRLGPGLKVGIAWKGIGGEVRKIQRDIPLVQWAPILSLPSCHFVSLQHGEVGNDIATLRNEAYTIVHWEDALNDLEETATLIQLLDLVVTVCTSIAHLAGALGKPVWIIAPTVPEWVYLPAGETIPWYPAARLFRATQENEWDEPITAVADALLQHRASAG